GRNVACLSLSPEKAAFSCGHVKILHLLGDRVDLGGILSVVRNLDEATKHIALTHHAWVHESYVEGRRPPLSYRFSRHMRAGAACIGARRGPRTSIPYC